MDKYNTVAAEATSEFTEKKSRFISHISPVSCESEALDYIEKIKKQYWDARHNVYAYIIGNNSDLQRYSDDGEPQGTGGIPMLEVLRGEKLTNTVAVVNRYFGGTLLGTGGLVRAYTKGAKDGITAAGIITKVLYTRINVTVDYTAGGKVQYAILQGGYRLEDTIYTENICYVVFIEKPEKDIFIKNITNLTGGKAKIDIGDEIWETERNK